MANTIQKESKIIYLQIGQNYENLGVQKQFDVSEWTAEFPDAHIYLLFKRPGEEAAAPVNTTLDEDGILTWTVSNWETGIIGIGFAEIRAIDSSTGLVKKSHVIPCSIEASVTDEDEAPDYPSWVDRMLQFGENVDSIYATLPHELEEGIASIQQEAQEQTEAIEQKGITTRASIPADYTTLSDDVTNLKSATNKQGKEIFSVVGNPLIEFTDNAFITANTSVIDINNKESSNLWRCAVVPCTVGDVFVLNAVGAVAQRVYAIVDAEGNRLYSAASNLSVEDYKLTINYQNAAYLIINDKKSGGLSYYGLPNVERISRSEQKIILLDELFFLEHDVTGQLENGYYVTNQEVGETVPTTKMSSSSDKCGIFSCKSGDIFTISGKGGSSPRAWAFTDTTYKMLEKSGIDAVAISLSVTAKQDGYFFFNSDSSRVPTVYHKYYSYNTDNTLSVSDVPADAKATGDAINSIGKTIITDPKRIPWLFGEMARSGRITYNSKGVVTIYPIRILKGSVISPINSTIKFNANITFDDGITYYKAWDSNGYTMPGDGYARISVGLSSGADIHNLALLDNLTISIVCDIAPASKFIRTDSILGHIPYNDYVGRHVDTSGFNQNTEYESAIQPWRDFAVNNSGYIAETDYGEIYSGGPHQYGYTLIPPNASISGKKLASVFIVTSQHGHEKSATYGMAYLIKDMLEHSLEDPVLFYLRNYVRFIILPIANPYGWNADSTSGAHGGIRQNENGVNLNRNFGVSTWANYDDDDSYNTPGGFNYRGTAPFSEIETQNIRRAIVESGNDASLIIDIHTYGLDTTSASTITYVSANKDSDKTMKKLYESFDRYLCGIKNHMDVLYGVNLGLSQIYGIGTIDQAVNMTMQDYGYDACQVPSVTLELPCGSTNGFLGDNLSKYSPDIIKLCGEMIGNFIAKALYCIHESAL